jgi:hypothetical protein
MSSEISSLIGLFVLLFIGVTIYLKFKKMSWKDLWNDIRGGI